MKVIKSKIQDLLEFVPEIHLDKRGYFFESYNEKELHDLGFRKKFVQDNESKSIKGVLRGLHFQTKFSQGKLIRCVEGRILDVAVDLRKDSLTYGKWDSVVLDSNVKNMFYVPEGFAHGYLVISDEATISYKCTDFYNPVYEAGIIWNDPEIAIDWKLNAFGINQVILSEKDSALPNLSNVMYKYIKEA